MNKKLSRKIPSPERYEHEYNLKWKRDHDEEKREQRQMPRGVYKFLEAISKKYDPEKKKK